MPQTSVATFYEICSIRNTKKIFRNVERKAIKEDLLGTFFITPEGINTTLSGHKLNILNFLTFIREELKLDNLNIKWSESSQTPFKRLKIKIKPSLLPLPGNFDLLKLRGTHITPQNWNNLIKDPETILIDMRNEYETNLGTFVHAINPKTTHFIDIPSFIEGLGDLKEKKIAMFCTGGIRCEVASSFMLNKGYKNIYQLEGGILSYLEKVDKKDHLWRGECFVFDERVSVDQDLQPGKYVQCFGCRRPLSSNDLRLKSYVEGISCRYCIKETSEKDKLRFQERQKQINLAKDRGTDHFGKQ